MEKIINYENKNSIKLPQGYKDFIVMANGFDYSMTQILPLEKVELIEIPKEWKGYYMLGSYIGDGSLLLSDNNGGFYYGDCAFGIKRVDFSSFLEKQILYYMKDEFKEYNLEIPNNLNTRKTEEEIKKEQEKRKEILQELKEKKLI